MTAIALHDALELAQGRNPEMARFAVTIPHLTSGLNMMKSSLNASAELTVEQERQSGFLALVAIKVYVLGKDIALMHESAKTPNQQKIFAEYLNSLKEMENTINSSSNFQAIAMALPDNLVVVNGRIIPDEVAKAVAMKSLSKADFRKLKEECLIVYTRVNKWVVFNAFLSQEDQAELTRLLIRSGENLTTMMNLPIR
jgi:hypothetical protein